MIDADGLSTERGTNTISVTELKSYLGIFFILEQVLTKHVHGVASTVRPAKKESRWVWGKDHEKTF